MRSKGDEGQIGVDGTIEWCDEEGGLHRTGGPACVYVNGTEKWYREGKRHRDDGPAAIYPDGRKVWFIEGEKVREERSAH